MGAAARGGFASRSFFSRDERRNPDGAAPGAGAARRGSRFRADQVDVLHHHMRIVRVSIPNPGAPRRARVPRRLLRLLPLPPLRSARSRRRGPSSPGAFSAREPPEPGARDAGVQELLQGVDAGTLSSSAPSGTPGRARAAPSSPPRDIIAAISMARPMAARPRARRRYLVPRPAPPPPRALRRRARARPRLCPPSPRLCFASWRTARRPPG